MNFPDGVWFEPVMRVLGQGSATGATETVHHGKLRETRETFNLGAKKNRFDED